MPKRIDLKSILIIGAGPIVIGQACEFDYSVPLDFAADGAFVAIKLSGDFGNGAVAGQVLDMVSFVLGQLYVSLNQLSWIHLIGGIETAKVLFAALMERRPMCLDL